MTLPLHIPFILAISLLFCPPTIANQVLRLPISGTLQEQQLLDKFEFFTTLDTEVPQNDATLPLVQSEISSYMDIQYFVDLQFGTIGQGFRVLVDTGSSWLWIPGDIFKGTKFTNKYPCREENGCIILENKTRTLRYGEGLVHGLLTKDQVCLSNSQSCAVGQSFLLVVDQTDFGGIEGDGILGLSIKDQVDGIPMFLATLKEQGVIKEKVFSLYLEGKHKQGVYHGELILGGVSQDVVGNNQIVYEDVVNTKFWSVGLQGVQIVSQGTVVSQWKHDYQALIDSGTSCLHVPNDQYEQFMSDLETIADVSLALSASEIKYYDCRLHIMDKFPTIEIFFADTTFQLKPDDYILEKGNNCFVMFQPSPVSNIWVFGDVFMHRVHTIFDLDRKRIGFVQDSQAQSKVLTQGEYVMLGLVGMIFGFLVFFGTAGWGLISLIRKLKVKSNGEGVEKMIEIASTVVGGDFNNSSYEKNTI